MTKNRILPILTASLLACLALATSVRSQPAKEERIEDPSKRHKDRKEVFLERKQQREEEAWSGWRPSSQAGTHRSYRREGQLIVRYRQDPQGSSAQVRRGLSLASKGRWLSRETEVVEFDESMGFSKMQGALLANPLVEGVEPNIRFQRHQADAAEAAPGSRENRTKQEYLSRFRDRLETHGFRKRGAAAQGSKRGKPVDVAILDTGIDPDHPQLADAMGEGFNAIYARPVALPVPEEDMDSTAMDYNGHGTMVAGIIGARSRKDGIEGMDDQATLHSVKVLDRNGIGDLAGVLAGLHWAIDHHMDLVNMSFGSYEHSPALEAAIAEASAAGIVMVAAAGNDFADDAVYPGKFAQVVCVGSLEEDYSISRFSNWGADVDLYAPGFQLYSTQSRRSGESYGSMTGTSASAAYITGILSLLESHGLEGAKAVAAAKATALLVSNSINPRDGRFPMINEDALFGEVSRLETRNLALTRFDLKAVPASYDGSMAIDFRVQNGGRSALGKTTLEVEFTCGNWSRKVSVGAIPSLRPRQEFSGHLDVPIRSLVPADWSNPDSGNRILDYRVDSPLGLERIAKGSLNLFSQGTPMLEIKSVWIDPMHFLESRKDRTVSVLLANAGSAPLHSLEIVPTYWEGTHESVWRSPNHQAGPAFSAGSLEPGEVRLVRVPAPDLDGMPKEFTLDLAVSAGGEPISNYLQSHVFSTSGEFVAQYAQVVHVDLARQAIQLLKEQGVYIPELHDAGSPFYDGAAYREWGTLPSAAKYTADYWTDSWLAANLPSTLKYTLVNGAHDCDGIDVTSWKSGADTWDTHFWIVDNNDNDGLGSSPSAYNKIVNLMGGGKKGGNLNYGAVDHYRNGNKKAAWWFVGHAVHLIGDLSLGSHVNEENYHGVIKNGIGIGDVYHGWMDAGHYTGSNWSTALGKGGFIDPYQAAALGNPLRFLAYSTAQVGNSFPWAHTGDGTDQGKAGNRDLYGEGDHYSGFLTPVLASFNKRPLQVWHINKNEVVDACPGACCPCADECQLVDIIGGDETSADCMDHDGTKDLDNTDFDGNGAPMDLDGDITRIRNDAYPFAIRAAAGLIYYFAMEAGLLAHRSMTPIMPLLM